MDAIFRIAIKGLIALGTALIFMLASKRIHTLTKELDNYRANDTTMVAVNDTTIQLYIQSK